MSINQFVFYLEYLPSIAIEFDSSGTVLGRRISMGNFGDANISCILRKKSIEDNSQFSPNETERCFEAITIYNHE